MKVTIIQLDIAWGNPEENIKRIECLMAQQPESDLYVLPEMWSTGFATEPSDIAEEEIEVPTQKQIMRQEDMNIAELASIVFEEYSNCFLTKTRRDELRKMKMDQSSEKTEKREQ